MAKFLILSILVVLGIILTSEATLYSVGDSAGWDISADLPSWTAGKTFYVGDVLLFQYSKYHTLNMVDRDGYNNCNATNALLTGANGNTTVPLTTPGEKYFICGIVSHCLGGMKLQVDVERRLSPPPAGAPQSPVYYPGAPPPLNSSPSTKNDNPPASGGEVRHARGSTFVAWLCTIGALFFVAQKRV